MIYVSQGHEKGIGIEIFLKSFLCLDNKLQSNIIFFCFKESLINTLNTLNFDYSLTEDSLVFYNSKLRLKLLDKVDHSQSNTSLITILKEIKKEDHLVTLPTSKDQFCLNNEILNGHTEFFRKYFNNNSISMNFISSDFNCLLLTDHISVSEIEPTLNEDYILNKVSTTLDQIDLFKKIDEVIFSGINPHNGENGLISKADEVLFKVIDKLSIKYKKLKIHGPYPADTIHFKGFESNKLFVYASHDQGLAPYKLYNGLIGINLSLGLSFLRTSVDHGTAFDLYGKNSANYLGMLYLFETLKTSQKKPRTKSGPSIINL